MRGAPTKQTFRQWKVKTLEIEDGETKRITKKILHDEYMKPYPFEIPERLFILIPTRLIYFIDIKCLNSVEGDSSNGENAEIRWIFLLFRRGSLLGGVPPKINICHSLGNVNTAQCDIKLRPKNLKKMNLS